MLPIEDLSTALTMLDVMVPQQRPAWNGNHRAHQAALREFNRRRIDALAGAIPGVAVLHLEGKCSCDTMVHTSLDWLQTKHPAGGSGLALFNLPMGRTWYHVPADSESPAPLAPDSAPWAEVRHLEADTDQFIAIAKSLAGLACRHRNLPDWHPEHPPAAPPGSNDAIDLHL
ncbi:hypothetical protein BG418_30505 [Streptomyces sp. CBMA152]|nr:hypothetical protein [Streptomyces sp. CBMA152]